MKIRLFPLVVAVVLTAAFGATALAAEEKPAYKWRIELDHTTDNDGEIVFRIAPEGGGTPIDVTTRIPAKTGENRSAKILRDSFKASLGKAYKVEVDDGEDVLVKAKGKTPKFMLTMVSTTLTGLEVEIEHD